MRCVCQEHNRRPTGFHSKPETGGLRFYHLVRNVTGTVACHPWLGADFHCRSVFIADWSKYGFPVDATTRMSVTFPCPSNVNRKRPVPPCPGRDWPGGNDGAGAKSNRGFGVACGVGLVWATCAQRARVSGLTRDKTESKAATGRAMFFSPADVTMPTTSPFSFTTGDPTELAAVAPAISNRSGECAVMVISRALPSFPASELPTTATFAPVESSPVLVRSRNLKSFWGLTSALSTAKSADFETVRTPSTL